MRLKMVLAAAAALLAVAGSPSLAADAAQPAQQAAEVNRVEGLVRGVNPLERTIEVDGHAGLFPKRLVVDQNTTVTLPDGQKGSITSICEGDRVEASYREVNGDKLAEDVKIVSRQEQAGSCPKQ